MRNRWALSCKAGGYLAAKPGAGRHRAASPALAGPLIDIKPEAGPLLVELLEPVDVGNRDDHELELVVHDDRLAHRPL